jgi:phosphoglycolate phosphatase
MLERLGVFPAQAAMVGDHPMDILVGKQAGAFTIGVLTGHTSPPALQGAGADLILDRATDITHVLPL